MKKPSRSKGTTWTEVKHPSLTTPLTVEYTFISASRGSRDAYGVPLEPDTDAYIELEHVWYGENELDDILDIISHRAIEEIKALIIQAIEDEHDSERAADLEYESRHEKGLD